MKRRDFLRDIQIPETVAMSDECTIGLTTWKERQQGLGKHCLGISLFSFLAFQLRGIL